MMESSDALNCPRCGTQVEQDALFCPSCGTPMTGPTESSAVPVPYMISPLRILVMSILSFGLYTTYWLYKTWKHHKEHTGEHAFPVWHGLTALVPVYGSFRAHAHLRIFGELAGQAGHDLRFNPRLAFYVVLAGFVLTFIALGLSSPEAVEIVDPVTGVAVIDPETELVATELIYPTRSALVQSLFLRSVAIVAGIWLLLHAQPRINYYWYQVYGGRLLGVTVGKGEILVGIIGALGWYSAITGILSASA